MRAHAARSVLACLVLALALLAPALAGAGGIHSFAYPSPALKREGTAQVYVPSGEAPDDGWPVLYLLHGLHGAATDWNILGSIGQTLDQLIAQKKIRPLLVVMPDGGNSWYVDSAAIGGPGDFATAIGHDLQVAVEDAFEAGDDREHRAIAGISMGGYGALRLAFAAPDRYAAVAALSPAIWQNIPAGAPPQGAPPDPARTGYFHRVDPATVTIGIDLPPRGDHFGTAFGTPFDPARFNADNVFTLLAQAVEAHRALPPVFLSVGDDDSHGLWRGSIALFETMQMNHMAIDFRVTDGDHTWALWKKTIVDAILFADAHLGRPAIR